MIEFNINYYVHVKLTKAGLDELERQHNELQSFLNSNRKFKLPKTDKEGYSKWQMHDLMNRFGHMCRCSSDIPFETIIKIDVPK